MSERFANTGSYGEAVVPESSGKLYLLTSMLHASSLPHELSSGANFSGDMLACIHEAV